MKDSMNLGNGSNQYQEQFSHDNILDTICACLDTYVSKSGSPRRSETDVWRYWGVEIR